MQCLYYTSRYTCIHVYVHVYYTHTISDALIVRSVIGIGDYQPLFLKDVTDIVISVLIMSFLVMITSLIIAFMILIIIEKMLIFV